MARILVIDDDPAIRALASVVLEGRGDRVVVASNGLAGMAAFRSEPFDLVVTDIVMPYQEGLATIAQIRRDSQKFPILAISGSGTVGRYGDYLHAATLSGASATLAKPFTPEALIEKVDRLLHR